MNVGYEAVSLSCNVGNLRVDSLLLGALLPRSSVAPQRAPALKFIATTPNTDLTGSIHIYKSHPKITMMSAACSNMGV